MSEVNELNLHLKELERLIKRKRAVEALQSNNDFQDIILEGFCHHEMERCLGLAVCEKVPPETRELCNQMAKASATLKNYLDLIVQSGVWAEDEINEVKDRIEELSVKGEE